MKIPEGIGVSSITVSVKRSVNVAPFETLTYEFSADVVLQQNFVDKDYQPYQDAVDMIETELIEAFGSTRLGRGFKL